MHHLAASQDLIATVTLTVLSSLGKQKYEVQRLSNSNETWADKYTAKQVAKILLNYWHLWAIFEPKGNATDTGTHFTTEYSSNVPRDGKKSARRREEILCALFDVEDAIPKLAEGDRQRIMDHYIKDVKD